jgi:hypothetical protein
MPSTSSSISSASSRPGACDVGGVRADVDHADAVVGVEHRDRVVGPDLAPARGAGRRAGVQRVQHQRGQREVVDPVDALGDLELLAPVAVDLDQDLDAAGVGAGGEVVDEGEGLLGHERRGARRS